jgi:nitroreductase
MGEPMPASEPSPDTLRLLGQRRSAPVAMLGEPGPSPDDVDALLTLAMRAPDHRKLEPWRFLVFQGDARGHFADLLTEVRARDANATEAQIAEARTLPLRTPVIVAVVFSPVQDPKGTPEWEQQLSAGAVCQNLLVAAAAAGWDGAWITGWPAYSHEVAERLGLAERERFAGFIYLGTSRERPVERVRPDPAVKVQRWTGR